LPKTERISGPAVTRAYVDRGYRGHGLDDQRYAARPALPPEPSRRLNFRLPDAELADVEIGKQAGRAS
jgi:hypothetical protein